MPFIDLPSGAVLVEGRAAIEIYRLLVLKAGLQVEVRTGGAMKLTRGRSCYSRVKEEFGFKGTREKVLDQLITLINTVAANAGAQEEQ